MWGYLGAGPQPSHPRPDLLPGLGVPACQRPFRGGGSFSAQDPLTGRWNSCLRLTACVPDCHHRTCCWSARNKSCSVFRGLHTGCNQGMGSQAVTSAFGNRDYLWAKFVNVFFKVVLRAGIESTQRGRRIHPHFYRLGG